MKAEETRARAFEVLEAYPVMAVLELQRRKDTRIAVAQKQPVPPFVHYSFSELNKADLAPYALRAHKEAAKNA